MNESLILVTALAAGFFGSPHCLGTAAMAQKDSPSLLLLALSGIGPAMALVRLFWILVTTKR